MTTIVDDALLIASLGLGVFPCHTIQAGQCSCKDPACRRQGKHPKTPNGLKDATRDKSEIAALWRKYSPCNIGAATTGELFVIDLDNKPEKNGLIAWEAITDEYFETPQVVTGSMGRHIYFRAPAGSDIRSGTDILHPGIDIRGAGGYVIAPTSLHISGKRYEWADDVPAIAMAPQWLLDRLKAGKPRCAQPAGEIALDLSKDELARIRSALNFIEPDDRDIWLQVGMAIKSESNTQAAFAAWNEWSQLSEKYEAKDQRRVWASMRNTGITLGTLFHLAAQAGWSDMIQMEPIQVDFSAFGAVLEPEKAIEQPLPPGIMGTMAQWIADSSFRRQPLLANQAAIALISAAVGPMIQTDYGGLCNMYLVALAPTAGGKERPREAIKQALTVVNRAGLIGGDRPASGSGIISRLQEFPNTLYLWDELGLLLQGIADKNSGRWSKEIINVLMSLYSASNSFYNPADYVDRKKKDCAPIVHPYVTIFGTSTPETFYRALTGADVLSGFMNRQLVVSAPDRGIPQRPKGVKMPSDWAVWFDEMIGCGERVLAPEKVIKAPHGQEVFDLFFQYSEKRIDASRQMAPLWGRAFEMSEKLAALAAVSTRPLSPIIMESEADWACNYVNTYIDALCKNAELHLADNEFHGFQKEILRQITRAGKGGLTERQIMKLSDMKKHPVKIRKEIIDALIDSGDIRFGQLQREDKLGRQNKTVNAYFAASVVGEKKE